MKSAREQSKLQSLDEATTSPRAGVGECIFGLFDGGASCGAGLNTKWLSDRFVDSFSQEMKKTFIAKSSKKGFDDVVEYVETSLIQNALRRFSQSLSVVSIFIFHALFRLISPLTSR